MSNKKKKNNALFIIIIIICAAVAVFSLSQIIISMLNYKHVDEINNSVTENLVSVVDETADDETAYKFDMAAAKATNPDTIGLLYIPSLESMLPIVQGTDDNYYLHHAYDGSESIGGTVFLEASATNGINASNLLLYGHYMKNGAMFGSHKKYKDKAFYDEEGNDTFYVYTENSVREYKIFSVMNVSPTSDVYTFNFSTDEQVREYAQKCKGMSMYDTGVDVSNAKQVVTLSSCEETDYSERLVIQGVLVNETFE